MLLLLLLLGVPMRAQFSTTTTIVRVEARAVDAKGLPVEGLTKAHFRVTDNEVEQEVERVAKDELPLDLALVIDVSGSMKPHVGKIAATARKALDHLRQGDRVMVMTFNASNRVVLALTDNLDAAVECLADVAQGRFGGGTTINTPIRDAAILLRRESAPDRRRAVLILTDGIGMKGTRSARTIEELWEADATLNALMVKGSGLARGLHTYRRATSPVALLTDASVPDIATKSGGETMQFQESRDPLGDLLLRIRSRYTVYYRPSAEKAKEHKVFVTLSEEGKRAFPAAKVSGRRQLKGD